MQYIYRYFRRVARHTQLRRCFHIVRIFKNANYIYRHCDQARSKQYASTEVLPQVQVRTFISVSLTASHRFDLWNVHDLLRTCNDSILYPKFHARLALYISVNAILQESCKNITNPKKEFLFHEFEM